MGINLDEFLERRFGHECDKCSLLKLSLFPYREPGTDNRLWLCWGCHTTQVWGDKREEWAQEV